MHSTPRKAAADDAQPGDNVAIAPGSYDGGPTIDNNGSDGQYITFYDVTVYHNVSYGNAQAGLGFWVESDGTMSNIQVVNDTFADNDVGSIAFDVPAFDLDDNPRPAGNGFDVGAYGQ